MNKNELISKVKDNIDIEVSKKDLDTIKKVILKLQSFPIYSENPSGTPPRFPLIWSVN